MNFTKLFFLLLSFLNFTLASDTISIKKDVANNEILTHSQIFLDYTQLSLEKIKTQQFQNNTKETLTYGYSPNFTVWIKFTLTNNTNQPIEKILEYGNPLTTHVELYYDNNHFKDGLYQINSKRKSLNPTFTISINPHQTTTYYLKASSVITTLIVKLNLWEIESFTKQIETHNMILVMFFTSMIILTIYNLFIYFLTNDRNYLFYILFMVGIVLHQLIYTGFGTTYIFSQALSILLVKSATLIVAFPLLMLALLVKSFLKLSLYPLWNKALNLYLYIFIFLSCLFLITDMFNQYRTFFAVLLLLFLIIITIYATIKKNRQAYFMMFGWFLFAIAALCMYFSSIGVFYIFDDFKYFVEVALILDALVFSIALADKINQLEQKKNEANMELILNQQFEKQRLEYQVKEKTKALKKAYDEKNLLLKELNHRVKNNMQTIISLIRLQSQEIQESKIKEMFQTIQNRISAMSVLHELLYNQDDPSHINAFDYFEKLVDELKESFATHNIKIEFDINANIKAEQAVYCGLIVNELITNAFKYAFQGKTGTIKITLKKENNQYNLIICDNGIGYDTNNHKDTLGLILVDTLATKQLKGTIQHNTKDGVKVEISWN